MTMTSSISMAVCEYITLNGSQTVDQLEVVAHQYSRRYLLLALRNLIDRGALIKVGNAYQVGIIKAQPVAPRSHVTGDIVPPRTVKPFKTIHASFIPKATGTRDGANDHLLIGSKHA